MSEQVMKRPSGKRPLGRRLQARVMGALNVPMRVLLGLPFATPLSGRLMLVSYTGRKTGRRYRQPVSYVRPGGTHGDVLLTPGGGNWKWNLQGGQPVRLRLRGRDVLAKPELVADPDQVEQLLGVMTATNPTVAAFVGVPKRPDGRLDRARLEEALHHGFRVVRWQLDAGVGEGTAVRA